MVGHIINLPGVEFHLNTERRARGAAKCEAPERIVIMRPVMRPGRKRATKEQTYLWQTVSSSGTCSGSLHEIWIRFLRNHIQVSSKVVSEDHDIPRPGSGDLLMDPFWVHDEYAG